MNFENKKDGSRPLGPTCDIGVDFQNSKFQKQIKTRSTTDCTLEALKSVDLYMCISNAYLRITKCQNEPL